MSKRVLRGKVISHKMDKTAVVVVQRLIRHPLYSKQIVRLKKYYAHDEHNAYGVGSVVSIQEHRPISKTKKWIILAEGSEVSNPGL